MLRSIGARKNNLTRETIRRIRRMIAAVKAEPEFYDQNTCGKRDHSLGGCETVCCATGWSVWLDNPKKYNRLMTRWLVGEEVDWEVAGLKALHLVDTEARWGVVPIFGTASSWPAPFADDYYYAFTPTERAEVFGRRWERFIATDGKE